MKDDGLYLAHIRDAIRRIESYTEGGENAFMREPMIQDAVIRNLEIIGEATKNLSEELRRSHPQIPWRQMAGMRDVLIHDYLGVNVVRVWGVVAGRLPELKREVSKILEDSDEGGASG